MKLSWACSLISGTPSHSDFRVYQNWSGNASLLNDMHYKGSYFGSSRLIAACRSSSASNVQESLVCLAASSDLKHLHRKQSDSFLKWIYHQAKIMAMIDMAHIFCLNRLNHRKSKTLFCRCVGQPFLPFPQPSTVPPFYP